MWRATGATASQGSSDDAIINDLNAGANVTIGSNVESVNSVTATGLVDISGGGLTVAASSTLSGGLTMTGGSLTANGSGISVTVTGTTSISTSSLYSEGGAILSLPQLTTYTGGGDFTHLALTASGAGSVLSLPALTTVTSTGGVYFSFQIGPDTGGDVELPVLTQITGPVSASVSPGSGTLNFSQLTTFTGGTLAYSGGILEMPVLANASGSTLQISGGASMSLPTLTKADNANLNVSGGATLDLPNLITYTGGGDFTHLTLTASGAGSVLSLPALTTVTSTGGVYFSFQIGPDTGGDVELPVLTQITGPVGLATNDGGSTLNLSRLTTFTGGTLTYGGGNLEIPALANASSSTINVSGESSLDLSSLAGATLNVTGGVISLPDLTDANNSPINVNGGAVLNLPPAVALTAVGATVTVVGDGSELIIGSEELDAPPTSGNAATINVPPLPQGMTLDFNPNGTFSGGTTFDVGAGADVNVQSGTYNGGVTFNVGAQTTVDLTGGQTVTYAGTLTGSGSGAVQFTGGTMTVGVGGSHSIFPATCSSGPEVGSRHPAGTLRTWEPSTFRGRMRRRSMPTAPSTITARSSSPGQVILVCTATPFHRLLS